LLRKFLRGDGTEAGDTLPPQVIYVAKKFDSW